MDDQLAHFLLGQLAATTDGLVLGVEGLLLIAGDFKYPGVSVTNYVNIARGERIPALGR